MKTRHSLYRLLPIAALAAGLVPGIGSVHAQAAYQITLNTSRLNTPAYSGPFLLDFQFVDGDGALGMPNSNNIATVSNFTGGTNFSMGTVTLADGTPSDTPPTGEGQVGFTPGSTLSFLTTLTTNEDQFYPDEFSFGILDGMGNPIPTQDASGNSNGAFVTIDESSDPNDPSALMVTTMDTPAGEFTPTVTPIAAPEPGGGLTLALGLAAVGVAACAHRRRNNGAVGRA